MSNQKSYECCILGAGPAGLGAALELSRHGVRDLLILDRHPVVGGLARTEIYDGARFDVGPHRFFTKNAEINQLWHQLLGKDFQPVERLTRIYYRNKYFNYPLKISDALIKLGVVESSQAILSFAAAKLQSGNEAKTFEDWTIQKFGRKLYETFFKTYTEKVWGIPCREIGAEWAAQRIKGLDVLRVLKHAVFSRFYSSRSVKTLVEEFDYPALGAGQMYEAMAEEVAAAGGKIQLSSRITAIHQKENRIQSVDVMLSDGSLQTITAKQFFTSLPITQFFKWLDPVPSPQVKQAAEALYYRDHITVNLLIDGEEFFSDQWIYIHSSDVKMARIANYNNFSKSMAGGKKRTGISVEYFTFQNEELWKMSDEDLKKLAAEELQRIGLVPQERVLASWVVRETESYPTYYMGFQEPYQILKKELNQFANLSPIGRGGLYKYNNQDHSTFSGLLAARNYLKLPGSPYNIWNINIDAEYLESEERSYTSSK